MDRTINSHIQIPRFILDHFEDRNHFLYQLDVKDLSIRGGHAKTLNTKVGYYSNDTEGLLAKFFESPFAPILKQLKDFDFATNSYTLPDGFSDFVKQFFGVIFARSPHMFDVISRNSIYLQIAKVNEEDKPDFAVRSAMSLDCSKIFQNFVVGFISNRSSIPFVLPMCSAYGMRIDDLECILFPLAPNFAFIFMPQDVAIRFISNGTMQVLLITDDKLVRRMNVLALKSQQTQNYHDALGYGWVVTNNRKTLKILAEDYRSQSSEVSS